MKNEGQLVVVVLLPHYQPLPPLRSPLLRPSDVRARGHLAVLTLCAVLVSQPRTVAAAATCDNKDFVVI